MLERKKRVAFYTLGCKLNFSETSAIARQFEAKGYSRVSADEQADVYVINTCSVTQHADKKCRQAIRKFIKRAPDAKIAVIGCYAQLKPDEIASIEGVDLVLGANSKFNLPELLDIRSEDDVPGIYSCDIEQVDRFFPAYSSGDRTRSFLKVQDGCDYRCTYCTIPLARGKSRNMPIADIIRQANEIAEKGIKEIVLTGVNTGDFGKSTGETFPDLLRALDGVEGIERYRISSIEPNLISDEVVQLVADSSKFLPHFHIPLQSGSNRILGLMRRRYRRELFADRVNKLRELMPDAFFGVDVIVGFPGETPDDFEDTYRFLEQLQPSFLHVFPYSVRLNTPAARFPNRVDAFEITRRVSRLSQLSEQLHRSFYLSAIGSVHRVLLESTHRGELMLGYTENYIKVAIPFRKNRIGQIVKVRLVGPPTDDYIIGKVLE